MFACRKAELAYDAPAPPVFAGLMGIVGLWAGYGIVQRLFS